MADKTVLPKMKIAFFEFTSCEGCQLEFLNQGPELLDLLQHVEIVRFREAISNLGEDYEIAVIEGAITTPKQEEQIKEIRSKAKLLVAIGACATSGGINTLKDLHPLQEVREYVYGKDYEYFPTFKVKPLSEVVKVDFNIRGCPPRTSDIVAIFKELLLGKIPFTPDYPVCVECKMKENPCTFDLGQVCLGPITRAGCGAWCPSFHDACEGCRGLITNPALNGHRETLRRYNISPKEIIQRYQRYGMYTEEEGKDNG